MEKDSAAVDRLMSMVKQDQAAGRREAATALGQIGDQRAAPALVAAAARADDRFIEHAVTYALIELKSPAALLEALQHSNPHISKAALSPWTKWMRVRSQADKCHLS